MKFLQFLRGLFSKYDYDEEFLFQYAAYQGWKEKTSESIINKLCTSGFYDKNDVGRQFISMVNGYMWAKTKDRYLANYYTHLLRVRLDEAWNNKEADSYYEWSNDVILGHTNVS